MDGLSGADHFVAKENRKIRAVVADRIIETTFAGSRLKIGFIGSVAVHPDFRGKGYMINLMNLAAQEAKKAGVQLLLLSGKRQRYGYFGFENGGVVYRFELSPENVSHALADVDAGRISYHELTENDPEEIRFACELNRQKICHTERNADDFLRIVHSWNKSCFVICRDGVPVGYCCDTFQELTLKDESDYPAVIKAMFPDTGTVTVCAGMHERKKIAFLSSICEDYCITHCEKVCVLDWKAVLDTLLTFKSGITTLTDGEKSFLIDGVCVAVSVINGRVAVKDGIPDRNTVALGHNEAERLFFELDASLPGKDRFGNWFPLPFFLDNADAF